jgi:hypothetical protein
MFIITPYYIYNYLAKYFAINLPISILIGLQDFAQTACYSVHHKGLLQFKVTNHNILCSLSSLNVRY